METDFGWCSGLPDAITAAGVPESRYLGSKWRTSVYRSRGEEIFAELDKEYVSGITFSGGDPLHPSNISLSNSPCK